MTTQRVNAIFSKILKSQKQDSISIIHFMKSIENIIMEISPKETNKFYSELQKAQHKPGGAVNPPLPKNLKKLYIYLNINYEPSKRVYYLGKAKKKGHGKPLAYNQLPIIAKKSRKFLYNQFNI